jgi:hypothetical protein
MKCVCGGELTKEFGLINTITGEKKYPFIMCSSNRVHDEVSVHDFFDRCDKAEAKLDRIKNVLGECQVEIDFKNGTGDNEMIQQQALKQISRIVEGV